MCSQIQICVVMTQYVIWNTEITPDGLCRKTTQWNEGGKGVTKHKSGEVIKCSPLYEGRFRWQTTVYPHFCIFKTWPWLFYAWRNADKLCHQKTHDTSWFFWEHYGDIQHQWCFNHKDQIMGNNSWGKWGRKKVSNRGKLLPILRAGFPAGEGSELIFPETLLESKGQKRRSVCMSKHSIKS